MAAHHKHRSLWGVDRDRIQPEVQASMFIAQSHVPQQYIDGTIGQEKLQGRQEVYVYSMDNANSIAVHRWHDWTGNTARKTRGVCIQNG